MVDNKSQQQLATVQKNIKIFFFQVIVTFKGKSLKEIQQ